MFSSTCIPFTSSRNASFASDWVSSKVITLFSTSFFLACKFVADFHRAHTFLLSTLDIMFSLLFLFSSAILFSFLFSGDSPSSWAWRSITNTPSPSTIEVSSCNKCCCPSLMSLTGVSSWQCTTRLVSCSTAKPYPSCSRVWGSMTAVPTSLPP